MGSAEPKPAPTAEQLGRVTAGRRMRYRAVVTGSAYPPPAWLVPYVPAPPPTAHRYIISSWFVAGVLASVTRSDPSGTCLAVAAVLALHQASSCSSSIPLPPFPHCFPPIVLLSHCSYDSRSFLLSSCLFPFSEVPLAPCAAYREGQSRRLVRA